MTHQLLASQASISVPICIDVRMRLISIIIKLNKYVLLNIIVNCCCFLYQNIKHQNLMPESENDSKTIYKPKQGHENFTREQVHDFSVAENKDSRLL